MVRRDITEDDTGIKILYEPPPEKEIEVDIVFIHGIGAHPDDTWCKNVGSKETPRFVNWLSDRKMLPAALPNARIMRYGYMSEWFGDNFIQQNVTRVTQRFLGSLKRVRKEQACQTRPLLIGAHCFGGLVALDAFVTVTRQPKLWPSIYNYITGMLFFGTPFRGAHGEGQMKLIEAAQALHSGKVDDGVLRITQRNDELLQRILNEFEDFHKEQEGETILKCFFETKRCNVMAVLGMEGELTLRVDETSGRLDRAKGIPLFRNHFDMNKFGAPNEEEYMAVLVEIDEMVKEAPGLLATRFKHFPKNRRGSCSQQVDNEFKAVRKEVKKYFNIAQTDWQKVSDASSEPGDFQWATDMPQARSWIEDKGYRVLYVEYNDSWDCLAGLSHAFYQQLRQTEALEVIYGLAPTDAQEIRSGAWKTSLPRTLLAQILTHYPLCIPSMNKAIEDLDADEELEMKEPFDPGDSSWEHQWILLSCALHSLDKNVVLMFINFNDELYEDLEAGLSHLNTGHRVGSSRADFSCKVLIVGTPKSKTLRGDEQSTLFAMSPRRINEEAERKLCLSSLHFPDLHARRELIHKPEGSTTRWIWQHQAYTSLRRQSSSLLWIHGKPGSGKSTLAAALQRSLSKDSPDLLLADFFYSSRFGPIQRGHLWMLRSILYQLLQKHKTLYSHYRSNFRKFQASKSKSWTYRLLREILLKLRYATNDNNKGYTFLLIVDGIDESEHGYSTEASRERTLELFSHLCRSEKKSKFKIIALSRSESAIRDALRPTLSIDMKEVNRGDIERIVRYHLSRIWRQINHYNRKNLTASSSTLDDWGNDSTVVNEEEDIIDVPELEFVRTYLLKHADGVILWVVMVLREIESIAKVHTIWKLEQILYKIPTGLDELYEDIFNRLKISLYGDPGQATYVFSWLLFAQDVLTVCEFRDAMALFYWDESSNDESGGDYLKRHRVQQPDGNWDPTWTLLTNLCGGFIEIVPQGRSVAKDAWIEQSISPDDYVQLIHRTARDFILSKTETALRDSTRCVKSLCAACVNYLELTFVDDLDRLRPFVRHLDDRPLLRYMLKNLPGILTKEINERNIEATELYNRIVQYMAKAWLDQHNTVTWTFFNEFRLELFILERDNRLCIEISDDFDNSYLRQLEMINDDLSVNVDMANHRAPRNPSSFMHYLTREAEIVKWRSSIRTNMMSAVLRHIGFLFAKEHGYDAALKILVAAIGDPSSEELENMDMADSLSDYSGSLIRHHHKHTHHHRHHPRHGGNAHHDLRNSSRSPPWREYEFHPGEDSDDERLYSIRANYSWSRDGDLHRRNKRNRLRQLAKDLCIFM